MDGSTNRAELFGWLRTQSDALWVVPLKLVPSDTCTTIMPSTLRQSRIIPPTSEYLQFRGCCHRASLWGEPPTERRSLFFGWPHLQSDALWVAPPTDRRSLGGSTHRAWLCGWNRPKGVALRGGARGQKDRRQYSSGEARSRDKDLGQGHGSMIFGPCSSPSGAL